MATADCWLPGQTLNMHRIPLETSAHQNHLTKSGRANKRMEGRGRERELQMRGRRLMCVSVGMSDRWEKPSVCVCELKCWSVYAEFRNARRNALVLPN